MGRDIEVAVHNIAVEFHAAPVLESEVTLDDVKSGKIVGPGRDVIDPVNGEDVLARNNVDHNLAASFPGEDIPRGFVHFHDGFGLWRDSDIEPASEASLALFLAGGGKAVHQLVVRVCDAFFIRLPESQKVGGLGRTVRAHRDMEFSVLGCRGRDIKMDGTRRAGQVGASGGEDIAIERRVPAFRNVQNFEPVH